MHYRQSAEAIQLFLVTKLMGAPNLIAFEVKLSRFLYQLRRQLVYCSTALEVGCPEFCWLALALCNSTYRKKDEAHLAHARQAKSQLSFPISLASCTSAELRLKLPHTSLARLVAVFFDDESAKLAPATLSSVSPLDLDIPET